MRSGATLNLTACLSELWLLLLLLLLSRHLQTVLLRFSPAEQSFV
jgi:hypothetical protein